MRFIKAIKRNIILLVYTCVCVSIVGNIHVYVCRLLVYTCVCVSIVGIYMCMCVDCWYIHVYVCRLLVYTRVCVSIAGIYMCMCVDCFAKILKDTNSNE